MSSTIDPRAKLFLVVCLSTLGIVFENIWTLLIVLIAELIYAVMLQANVLTAIKKLRKMLYLIIGIVILQSLFIRTGRVLIGFNHIKIITDVGLIKGAGYLLRVMIIFLSGTIIATSDMRELIQGLIQLKLPYDLAFMASVGVKFLPLLMEQLKDTLIAIQLRGIDLNSLKLKQKLEIYAYIFTPVIVNTLTKAKQISISIEARGFRAFNQRTSIKVLKFKALDYVLALSSAIVAGVIIIFNWHLLQI